MKKLILSLFAISMLLIWQCNLLEKKQNPRNQNKQCILKFKTKTTGDTTIVSWIPNPLNQKGYTIRYRIAKGPMLKRTVPKGTNQISLTGMSLQSISVEDIDCKSVVVSTIIIDIDIIKVPLGYDIENTSGGYQLPNTYPNSIASTTIANDITAYINNPLNVCYQSSLQYRYHFKNLTNQNIQTINNKYDYNGSLRDLTSTNDDITRDLGATRTADIDDNFWTNISADGETQYLIVIKDICP